MNIHLKALLKKDDDSKWIVSNSIFDILLATFMLGFWLPLSIFTGEIPGKIGTLTYLESPAAFVFIISGIALIGIWFCFSAINRYTKSIKILRAK